MRHYLTKGQKVIMGEREYVIEQRTPKGDLILRDVALQTHATKTHKELVDLLFQGHLRLSGDEHAEAYSRNKMGRILEADLAEMPDAVREETRRRYNYVTGIIRLGVHGKTQKDLEPLIDQVAKALNDSEPPSYWQVYRWYKDYIASAGSVRCLFSAQSLKGNRTRRMQREVIEIMDKAIEEECLNGRLSPQAVYDTVVARIKYENDLRVMAGSAERLKIPSDKSVYRAIDRLDQYEVTKARKGKRYADLMFKPRKESIRPERPLQRVEIDHTKLDLFVVDFERRMPIGRPWITTAIDVFSKCVVGIYISFTPPSYLSVMRCLLHAISPKTYLKEKFPSIEHEWDAHGLMETAVVDNGREFHSEDFIDACLQLGIIIQYAPVKCPWYKASIERFFGTANTELLHRQPGTTFSNVMDKGDYDPKKNAVISFEGLIEMAHKFIVDIYHRDKHRGLMSTPAEVWSAGIKEFPPALPGSGTDLQVLLGLIEERTITSSGIELHHLFYNDNNLLAVRRRYKNGIKEKAKIKYDPEDLSTIYVLDEFKRNYVPVKAVSQSYTHGINLWQHQVICRYALEQMKASCDIVSLSLAKEELKKMVDREWNLTKRTGHRQKMARFNNLSQENYSKTASQKPFPLVSAQQPECPGLPHEVVLPAPTAHPANGISDFGMAQDAGAEDCAQRAASYTENGKTAEKVTPDAEGMSNHHQKKRGRPRKNGKDGDARGRSATDAAGDATPANCGPEELPDDLDDWGYSYMNEPEEGPKK